MTAVVQTEADVFWVEHLSPAESTTLRTFRQELESQDLLCDGHRDDTTLCRFLRARKWDVPKALEMWQEMRSWRQTYAVHQAEPPFSPSEQEAIRVHYPHFVHKTDKFGRPVHYELLGELDLPALMAVTDADRILKHHSLGWERTKSLVLPACSVVAQRDVYTCVSVIDLKGLKMASFTKDVRTFVAAVAKMDQSYYPEHLGQMFIVNAPMVFKAIFSAIKPFLEPRTQTKIQVISNERQARETLLQIIPAENLIKRLGGTSEVDPSAPLGQGPWADEAIRRRALAAFKYSSTNLTGSSSVSADTMVEGLAA